MKKQRGMSGNAPKRLPWLRDHVRFDGDECLFWPFEYTMANRRDNGCAQVMFKGRYTKATRVMCELAHGKPPTPKHEAAHSCGDSRCFNQKHLRWATKLENEADRIRHGKVPCGSQIRHLVKLTEDDVRRIKTKLKHEPIRAIAREFEVYPWTIKCIRNNTTWKQVKG